MAKFPPAYFNGTSDSDRLEQPADHLTNYAMIAADGSLMGPDGTLITFDASGNIVAQVVHRTDLLAALLAAPGVLGELSVATDTDAIVVSQGATLAGKVYGRTSVVAEILLPGTFQTYNTGTYSNVLFTAIPEVDGYARSPYVRGLFDATTGLFTAPPAAFASHFSVIMDSNFTAGPAQVIETKIQYDSSASGDGSAWTDLGIVSRRIAIANTQPGKKHRIQALQNSGGTLYANLTPIVQFRRV